MDDPGGPGVRRPAHRGGGHYLHAADQLDKAGKCLEQVSALLSDQDVALEELSRAYDSTAPDKVPAPVPLEEEP